MSIFSCDYVKVGILALLYAIMIFSGARTFSGYASRSSTPTTTIKPNVALCNRYQGDMRTKCLDGLEAAFATAESECYGYTYSFQNCRNVNPKTCSIAKSNTENCYNLVTVGEMKKLGFVK
jgi:hypothetical protein